MDTSPTACIQVRGAIHNPFYHSNCCLIAVERLIKDNCQIDGDDLISYMDFVQSIKQLYEEGAA